MLPRRSAPVRVFRGFCASSSSYGRTKIMKTAGIIVIGDEVLKGHTKDTNSHFLSKLLHSVGVSVRRIVVIGDEIEEIANEVRLFSQSYDYVLTSGGIGPTHDDKTCEAVAHAFEEPVEPHQTLLEFCKDYLGDKPLNSPEMKMAFVPKSAVLHFGRDDRTGRPFRFPLITVKNVYLFPGIPSLLEKQARSLFYLFKGEGKFFMKEILVDDLETNIARQLDKCYQRFSSLGVSIGSYPDILNNYYKVKVIVESSNLEATDSASQCIMESLSQKCIVENYVKDPISLRGQDVFSMIDSLPTLRGKVKEATEIISEAMERYSVDEICIGFNGGKDCTALLHLYYAVLCKKIPETERKILALYVKDPNPFDEVSLFMEQSKERYNLQLITIDDKMKPALEKLKSEKPLVKAVLMGTRFTDPYSRNLTTFCPTDEGWPSYIRINPLLKWSYHDIWQFLRSLCLPYCALYDRGYTSLGSRENTSRNDRLKYLDENSIIRYRPAYTLQDGDQERNGRL